MVLETLDSIQKTILASITKIPELESFYLTGGTALSAFYLFHRKSRDLDIFTSEEELILPFSFKIEKALKEEGFEMERTRGLHSFIELYVRSLGESTVLHIALDSPFRLEPLKDAEEFPGLKIDSLPDIAANKLLALFGRANLRDFIDVFFLVKEKFRKSELIEKAMKKDPGFDLYWLGTALERINEYAGDSSEMHLLIKSCSFHDLKEFFNEWRREIFKVITKE